MAAVLLASLKGILADLNTSSEFRHRRGFVAIASTIPRFTDEWNEFGQDNGSDHRRVLFWRLRI
jgi:hypothetical protein